MVQDVGAYYQNATRLAAIAWKWATAQDASPNLYKIFVGEDTAPDEASLHYMWREYMGGGLDFILENGRQWWKSAELGLEAGGRVREPKSPEYLFGSAIGCAVGVGAKSGVKAGSSGESPRLTPTYMTDLVEPDGEPAVDDEEKLSFEVVDDPAVTGRGK